MKGKKARGGPRQPKSRVPLQRHAFAREMGVEEAGKNRLRYRELWRRLDDFVHGSASKRATRKGVIPDLLRSLGFIGVMINVTQLASASRYPLKARDFLTESSGQIRDQRSQPNRLLKKWGLPYSLGTESGGTSRGSIAYMEEYVAFLNALYEERGPIDHFAVMLYWMKKARSFFQSRPIEFAYVPNQTLRTFIRRLIAAVRKQEKQMTGVTLMGLVMQHMIGAKLEVVLDRAIEHHPSSQADQQYGRPADFLIEDCAIHVTTAPTELLIGKCDTNVQDGLRPIVVTLWEKVSAVETLAQNRGLDALIEVVDFEGFMTANILERSGFSNRNRNIRVADLVARYNNVVSQADPVRGIMLKLKREAGQTDKEEDAG